MKGLRKMRPLKLSTWRITFGWIGALVLFFGLAVGASAQTTAQETGQSGVPGPPAPPPPGPMAGMFSFEGALSDVSGKVVKHAPFSAVVVSETVEQLADGNRIDRKSVGVFARDGQGRTRREMTFENIGPWAASGMPPHLIFINDPVKDKAYVLNQNEKTAYRMRPIRVRVVARAMAFNGRTGGLQVNGPATAMFSGRGAVVARARHGRASRSDIATESLGEKKMDGLVVDGTRTIRTIPAGQIGNEKPIVIVTERWYSPALLTTVFIRRSDPRFGTSTFRLTHIQLSTPAPSLFVVPTGYKMKRNLKVRINPAPGQPGAREPQTPPGHDFP